MHTIDSVVILWPTMQHLGDITEEINRTCKALILEPLKLPSQPCGNVDQAVARWPARESSANFGIQEDHVKGRKTNYFRRQDGEGEINAIAGYDGQGIWRKHLQSVNIYYSGSMSPDTIYFPFIHWVSLTKQHNRASSHNISTWILTDSGRKRGWDRKPKRA